jgi:type VI secretion system secreted protein Hcp
MAVEIFMQIDDIKGESTAKSFEGAIRVESWNWGVSNPTDTHNPGANSSGKSDVQNLSFSHSIDLATPLLFNYCCQSKEFKKATLTVRSASTNPINIIVINMYKGVIASVGQSGSGGDTQMAEMVTLNFAGCDFTYKPIEGAAITKEWNCKSNTDSVSDLKK